MMTPRRPRRSTGAPRARKTRAAPTARRWARFTEWCAGHGRSALPASPETVAAFLAAEARAELAVNTLRLRHAAIRYLHQLAGYPPPTAAALVATTFAGIKRAHRWPLDKKTALVLDRLLRAIQAIPETLPGLRDRALLLVGFAAALRPSEISGLTLEHATRPADGIELFLPWRKNDQDARDTRLWLRRGALSSARSWRLRPGLPPRRSPTARCSGGSGDCRHRVFRGVLRESR
jgi:integrase